MTSGAYGFIINGQEKITIKEHDCFPHGLGKDVLEYIARTPKKEMLQAAKKIELVNNNESRPTKKQIEACKPWTNTLIAGQNIDDWYCLTYKAQGDLSVYSNGLKYMYDARAFLSNSIDCEWAYIINLDSGFLEIYVGLNMQKDAPGRYASEKSGKSDSYFGVTLAHEVPLDKIEMKTINDILLVIGE